jgi:GAG-pre-integrase domain
LDPIPFSEPTVHPQKTSGGLYRLHAQPSQTKVYANLTNTHAVTDINLLHHQLGHLGHDNVKCLVVKRRVEGVVSEGGHVELCGACIHGKQHRLPFPSSLKTTR